MFTGAQTIVRVKVETDIEADVATVYTTLHNTRDVPAELTMSLAVREWRSELDRGTRVTETVTLEPGESRIVSHELRVEDPTLWTLDDPFFVCARYPA